MNKQIHPTLRKVPLAPVTSTLDSRTINVGGIGTAYYDVGVGDLGPDPSVDRPQIVVTRAPRAATHGSVWWA